MESEKPFLRVLEFDAFNGGVVLAVEGEIDLATIEQIARPLTGICQRADAVTVDLRRVDFLDCLGLRTLVELSTYGAEHDCRVEFIQGPPPVARVFELTGASEQLAFVDAVSSPVAVTSA